MLDAEIYEAGINALSHLLKSKDSPLKSVTLFSMYFLVIIVYLCYYSIMILL